MCFTCEATAARTPLSHLLPSPPVTRPDMRAKHCALCLRSSIDTPTSFFQHKLCKPCTNKAPNALQTMQTRIFFFATRHLHIPLAQIHTEPLVAIASQLFINRTIPTLANTRHLAPILTQPPGPPLAALLAALNIPTHPSSSTYTPPCADEFALMLYRLSLPPPQPHIADTSAYSHNVSPTPTSNPPSLHLPISTTASHNSHPEHNAVTRLTSAGVPRPTPTPRPTPIPPPTTEIHTPLTLRPPDGAHRPRPSSPTSPLSPPPQRIRRIGPRFATQIHKPFSSPPPHYTPPSPQRPAASRSSSILHNLFGPVFSDNPPPLFPPRKGLSRSLRRPRQATSWTGEAAVRSAIFDLNPTRHKRRRAMRPDAAPQQSTTPASSPPTAFRGRTLGHRLTSPSATPSSRLRAPGLPRATVWPFEPISGLNTNLTTFTICSL